MKENKTRTSDWLMARLEKLQKIYQPTEQERTDLAHFLIGYMSGCLSKEDAEKAAEAARWQYNRMLEQRLSADIDTLSNERKAT